MDELLTPVSTTYRKSTALEEPLFRQVKISSPNPSVSERPPEARIQVVTSLDQVIEILKSQPGYDTLIAGLRFLGDDETGGRLSVGPKSASAIQLLVAEIGPNYWPLLSEGSLPGNDDVSESLDPTTTDAELYLRCLRNITGLNALLSQIKAFVLECKSISKGPARPDIDLQLSLLLQILAAVLAGDRALRTIWLCSIAGLASTVHIKVQQQIFTSIVVGGRLQSVAAEAHSCIEAQAKHGTSRWISDGTSYTRWAARNIVAWALSGDDEHEALPPALFQRAMTLGYPGSYTGLFTLVGAHSLTGYRDSYQDRRGSGSSCPRSGFRHFSQNLSAAVFDIQKSDPCPVELFLRLVPWLSRTEGDRSEPKSVRGCKSPPRCCGQGEHQW